MPYTIQQLDDLPTPVILDVMSDTFDTVREGPRMIGELNALLSHVEGDPVYVIVDITDHKMDFGDLVIGLATVFGPHAESNTSNLLHSRVKSVVVGTGNLVTLMANSVNQEQYGGGDRKLHMFKTLDEALDYIKQAQVA